MLTDAEPPPEFKRYLSREYGDELLIPRGRRHVVDGGVKFPRAPGVLVAPQRRYVLAIGNACVLVEGDLEVMAGDRAEITARRARVTTLNQAFARLLFESEGSAMMQSRFLAKSNSYIHVHDEASGAAVDQSTVFFKRSSTNWVRVRGLRVKVNPPLGRALEWESLKGGWRRVRVADTWTLIPEDG